MAVCNSVPPIPCCVFAKPPAPGKVKTRLAPAIGSTAAAELAACMLRDVWATVNGIPVLLPVLAADCEGSFPINVPPERLWLQQGSQLGLRIENILQRGLTTSPAAFAIGADSPLLTHAHLESAVNAISTHEAVIGPCSDGGFYLLGVRRCPKGLLEGVRWSHPDTCLHTIRRLEQHGMTVAQLAELDDVDVPGDLDRLEQQLRRLPETQAIFTRQWSASLSRR